MKKCIECGRIIPKERLETLPETDTCVSCSGVTPLTEDFLELDEHDKVDLVRSIQS